MKNHYEDGIEKIFEPLTGFTRLQMESTFDSLAKKLNLPPLEAASEYITKLYQYKDGAISRAKDINEPLDVHKLISRSKLIYSAVMYVGMVRFVEQNPTADWDHFETDIGFTKLMNSIIKYFNATEYDVAGMLCNLFFLAKFEVGGQRAYSISSGLAVNLIDTNIKGVLTDDVRLPYSTIMIQIPNVDSIVMPVDGVHPQYVYACEYERENGLRLWQINVISNVQSSHHIRIELEPGKKLLNSFTITEYRKFLVWFSNIIIYATWADAELEHVILNKAARKLWQKIEKLPSSSRKRANLEIKYKNSNPQARIILGRSVISRRNTTYITDGESSVGKQLEVRTLVEGHWRHYWVGKGRSHRERRWIKPFWRGPEDAPVSKSTHMLRSNYEEVQQ